MADEGQVINEEFISPANYSSPEEKTEQGVISFPALIIISITSVMGTGIFFLPAVGAKISGPASLISWVIMSVYAIMMAAVFAELAGMFSFGGGVYEYCKQAFGSFISFIVGWVTMLAGYVTIAMLVVGAIGALLPFKHIEYVTILGHTIPYKMVVISICLLFIVAFNVVAYMGMQTGTVMLITFGLITLSTIVALIIPSWFNGFQPANFEPFMPSGISSIFLTLFFIAETFFGWESICLFSPQVINGKKNVPKGLFIGTIIIVIICFLYVFSAMNGVSAETFGSYTTPIANLGGAYYGEIGETIFTLLSFIAIIGAVAAWIVAAPGLIQTLAEDKMFPAQLADLHPKRKTPYKAIIFQTIIISILTFAAAGQYDFLLHLLLPMVLVMYSFVVSALLVLRRKQPDTERTFKLPFPKLVTIFIIIFHIAMIFYWVADSNHLQQECMAEKLLEGKYTADDPILKKICSSHAMDIIKFGLSIISVGVPLYFLLLMYYDPDAIRGAHNKVAFLSLLTEHIFIPKSIKKEIFEIVGDLTDKEVLEYGCGVGTITMEIAKRVAPHKKIYAVHISERELEIANKRIKKKGHQHVTMIHDEHQITRIHPDVGAVDIIISFGMLSYMQNIDKLLLEMNNKLRYGGKICFIDYIDFFKVLPNNNWLADPKKIEELFHKAGLSVHIIKKKGLLWNYLFIYGMKSGENDALFI